MRVLSLFDGISVGRLALNRANINVSNYTACEIEPNAIKIAKYNFKDIWHCGDVKKFKTHAGQYDLILAGSPCQGFSKAGLQNYFADSRSALFFEFVRILTECQPKYFLLENVNMPWHIENEINKILWTKPHRINSNCVSAQNRERLYWTNIKFEKFQNKNITLSQIIGEHDGVHTLARGFNKGGTRKLEKSPCVTASCWEHNNFIVKNNERRKFTINEVEQLQTLPINYTSAPNVSLRQRYAAIGNSWTADVITHILKACNV